MTALTALQGVARPVARALAGRVEPGRAVLADQHQDATGILIVVLSRAEDWPMAVEVAEDSRALPAAVDSSLA
jgi:hypothetical protein